MHQKTEAGILKDRRRARIAALLGACAGGFLSWIYVAEQSGHERAIEMLMVILSFLVGPLVFIIPTLAVVVGGAAICGAVTYLFFRIAFRSS
jgi:hypothetical protein